MDVKLFGFSISLNLIILIAILYLIMTVNAITCACNEGFARKRRIDKNKKSDNINNSPTVRARRARRVMLQ